MLYCLRLGSPSSLLDVITLFLFLLLSGCSPSHFSHPIVALYPSDSAQPTLTVLLANWFMVPRGPILYQDWGKKKEKWKNKPFTILGGLLNFYFFVVLWSEVSEEYKTKNCSALLLATSLPNPHPRCQQGACCLCHFVCFLEEGEVRTKMTVIFHHLSIPMLLSFNQTPIKEVALAQVIH